MNETTTRGSEKENIEKKHNTDMYEGFWAFIRFVGKLIIWSYIVGSLATIGLDIKENQKLLIKICETQNIPKEELKKITGER